MSDQNLQPLQESFDRYQYEAELKALFLKLYEDNLKALADEIDTYGMPHNGPFSLIERLVTADGLSVLRQGDEAGMRYLWNAWKSLNPERGLHFIKTYLQTMVGDAHQVNQMWQKKSEPYPTDLRSYSEINYNDSVNIDDFFLTSRIIADIDTDVVPDRVVQSLKTAVAARFHLKVRLAKFSMNSISAGGVSQHFQVMRARGVVKDLPIYFSNAVNFSGAAVAFQMVRFRGTVANVVSPDFINDDGLLVKNGLLRPGALLKPSS